MSLERRSFVLDNGAYEIKAGFASDEVTPKAYYHALARSRDRRMLVSEDIRACRDMSGLILRRPIERGQLCSWEAEKLVWDAMFEDQQLIDPLETNLLLTEAPFTLPHLSSNTDQIVFEEYQFGGYTRQTPQTFASYATDSLDCTKQECCLVIDVGHTATHIVPVIGGRSYAPAIRRIDVAGKAMANSLKEQVTYRHIDLNEENVIVNAIKESSCFVASDHSQLLKQFRAKGIDCLPPPSGYALPDAQGVNPLGRPVATVQESRELMSENNEQVLLLGRERFNVPESLFNPRIVGLNQCGIVEAASVAVNSIKDDLIQELLWAQVLVVGGSSLIPGLFDRLKHDLRPWVPQEHELNVHHLPNPRFAAFEGGVAIANNSAVLKSMAVSRKDYLEQGESYLKRQFKPSDQLPVLN